MAQESFHTVYGAWPWVRMLSETGSVLTEFISSYVDVTDMY